MKKSHRIGDMFKEYYEAEDNRETGNFLIWRIESFTDAGQYRCVCVADDGNEECNVGDYVHFYWNNYAEWIEQGSMEDYDQNHFTEDLFTI